MSNLLLDGRIGEGTLLNCDDTGRGSGDNESVETLTVYAIKRIDPADAIAVGHSASDVIFCVRENQRAPQGVRRLMR